MFEFEIIANYSMCKANYSILYAPHTKVSISIRALGRNSSFVILGLSFGLWELQMCYLWVGFSMAYNV